MLVWKRIGDNTIKTKQGLWEVYIIDTTPYPDTEVFVDVRLKGATRMLRHERYYDTVAEAKVFAEAMIEEFNRVLKEEMSK